MDIGCPNPSFTKPAIYFIHGQSRGGPIPLTLQEALAKRVIEVREIGQVNELQVENTGAEGVFIQAGDIVKGGQQDRVLSVSFVLPPHSGATSIPSFCVESGRWSARGSEDVGSFSSANAALPSRVAKIAMAKTAPTRRDGTPSDDMAKRQREIWGSVSQIQGKLSANLGAPVAAPRSQTSLQLSLENPRLEGEQERYVSALHALGEQDNDIIGYAFAINGRLNSADIYPSNGLFRKMWPKLLRASATEAIAARDAANEPPLRRRRSPSSSAPRTAPAALRQVPQSRHELRFGRVRRHSYWKPGRQRHRQAPGCIGTTWQSKPSYREQRAGDTMRFPQVVPRLSKAFAFC